MDADAPIRATDTDALLARLSAVQKRYLNDQFIKHFVPRAHLQPSRPPLINIGTYVRSESIDRLLHGWLELCKSEGKRCQIVSLGAGSDTRFWRLATSKYRDDVVRYIELDFAEITSKKAMAIRKSRDLSAVLGENVVVANGGTTLHSTVYQLLATDLRRPPSSSLESLLTADGRLDPAVPTLVICECILAYMAPSASAAILEWFSNYVTKSAPLGVIVYEMFGLEDAFGRVMLNNMKTRNVELPGVVPYTSMEMLPQRLLQHEFTSARALTLRDIRNAYVPRAELERISKLEMLDEVEELDLVLAHYAITWGSKIPVENEAGDPPKYGSGWPKWGLHPDKGINDQREV